LLLGAVVDEQKRTVNKPGYTTCVLIWCGWASGCAVRDSKLCLLLNWPYNTASKATIHLIGCACYSLSCTICDWTSRVHTHTN